MRWLPERKLAFMILNSWREHKFAFTALLGMFIIGLDFLYLAFDACDYVIWGLAGIAAIAMILFAPIVYLCTRPFARKQRNRQNPYHEQFNALISRMFLQDKNKKAQLSMLYIPGMIFAALCVFLYVIHKAGLAAEPGIGIAGALCVFMAVLLFLLPREQTFVLQKFYNFSYDAESIRMEPVTNTARFDSFYAADSYALLFFCKPDTELMDFFVNLANHFSLPNPIPPTIETFTAAQLNAYYQEKMIPDETQVFSCIALNEMGVPFPQIREFANFFSNVSVERFSNTLNTYWFYYRQFDSAKYRYHEENLTVTANPHCRLVNVKVDGDIFLCVDFLFAGKKQLGCCLLVLRNPQALLLPEQADTAADMEAVYHQFLYEGNVQMVHLHTREGKTMSVAGQRFIQNQTAVPFTLNFSMDSLDVYWHMTADIPADSAAAD